MASMIETERGLLMPFDRSLDLTKYIVHHIVPMYSYEKKVSFRLFKISSNKRYILFAKHSGVKGAPLTQGKTVHAPVDIAFPHTLLPHQVGIFNDIVSILESTGTCYFKSDVGSGKTYVLGKVIEHFKLPTIIVGPGKNCKKAWVDMWRGAKYVTMNYALKNPTIFRSYGLTIIDEVHNIGTINRYEILWWCNTKYVVGCSATPNKLNGMDKFVPYFLGPLHDLNNLTVPYTGCVHAIEHHSSDEPLGFGIHDAYRFLERDCARNRIIVDIIRKTSQNMFVFAEHTDYLEYLCSLVHNGLLYTGKSKFSEAMLRPDAPNVVFTTYCMASESLSLKNFFVILFATPRKSNMIQIVGRILRNSHVDEPRHIYDFIDHGVSFFKKQFSVRRQYYRERNFKISKMKYSIYDELPRDAAED